MGAPRWFGLECDDVVDGGEPELPAIWGLAFWDDTDTGVEMAAAGGAASGVEARPSC